MTFPRLLPALLVGFATVSPDCARAQSPETPGVYSRLYAEFTSHPNRLVGSESIAQCFAALSNELAAAGLEPRTQTYASLVQKTDRLVLKVDGVEVPGALMVDNGVASWSRPEISGPVVYAGNGELPALEGKDLSGAIAVLDVRDHQAAVPEEAFMHGAAAVLVVGDGTLSQWDGVDLLIRNAALVPTLYLDAGAAAKAGLLDGTAKTASIDAFSRLVDTEGQNLWVVLPGEEGWKGNLDTEEVLLLSATLDTYGFTPDYTPDCRRAANAALLADVLCRMAKTPHKRTVVAVFSGSSPLRTKTTLFAPRSSSTAFTVIAAPPAPRIAQFQPRTSIPFASKSRPTPNASVLSPRSFPSAVRVTKFTFPSFRAIGDSSSHSSNTVCLYGIVTLRKSKSPSANPVRKNSATSA